MLSPSLYTLFYLQIPCLSRDHSCDTNLESMENGVVFAPAMNMPIVSPEASFSITCFVASGVRSRDENPVPPVVRTRLRCRLSDQSVRVACRSNSAWMNFICM